MPRARSAIGLGAIALVLAIWEIASRIVGAGTAVFPGPIAAFSAIGQVARGDAMGGNLLRHIGATCARFGIGLSVGVVLGIAAGILMGVVRNGRRLIGPLFSFLMPIPGIAWAPLFIIWFGFGNATIIPLGIMSTFFPLAISTAAGMQSVPRNLVWAARSAGVRGGRLVWAAMIPAASGYILSGLRLGVSRCWMTVVAVEFVAASNWGIGYMMWRSAEYLRSDIVYGGIIVLAVVYLALEQVMLRPLEKLTIYRWGMAREAAR